MSVVTQGYGGSDSVEVIAVHIEDSEEFAVVIHEPGNIVVDVNLVENMLVGIADVGNLGVDVVVIESIIVEINTVEE